MSSLFLIYATLISAPLNLEVRLAKRPLAGQAIQVVGFKNGEQVFKKDLKTDAAGRASVEIPSKLEAYILAQTIYQNVSYNSGILNSQALPKAVIPLTVFPTVANDSRVFVEDLRLFATETDQGVQIDEDILILNPTDKAVVGKASESESHETPESFRFQLPKGLLISNLRRDSRKKRLASKETILFWRVPCFLAERILGFNILSKEIDSVSCFNRSLRFRFGNSAWEL